MDTFDSSAQRSIGATFDATTRRAGAFLGRCGVGGRLRLTRRLGQGALAFASHGGVKERGKVQLWVFVGYA
jgi:hypothetical protein